MSLPTTEGVEVVAGARPALSRAKLVPAEERVRPVFVSATDRRARLVLAIGAGLATLTVLWVAALLAGAFGLRGLPLVPLSRIAGGNHAQAGTALGKEGRRGDPLRDNHRTDGSAGALSARGRSGMRFDPHRGFGRI